MPIAGSFPVFEEILTTCVKEMIPFSTCANFVNAIALTAEPSVQLFDMLIVSTFYLGYIFGNTPIAGL